MMTASEMSSSNVTSSSGEMSEPHPRSQSPIVEVRSLTKRYGTQVVLEDISHSFAQGKVAVVCGPSGCGKSTLLRCIHGLEDFQGGEIKVLGRSLKDRTVDLPRLRSQIGSVFQQSNLYPHLNCLNNVTLAPRKVAGRPRAEAEEEARKLLSRVGLAALAERFPAEISGGEQQRVAIARALAMQPKLMLFDEPTSSLDPERVSEVLDVMADLVSDHITMIIVTHEMRFAARVADEIIFIDAGKIVEVGGSDFCNNPKTERAKRFVKRILH
jgi:ABC-type polar amino acid transport system ATPase subunit